MERILGVEPRLREPKSRVLAITLYPYMVLPLGLEPSSSVLQTDAITQLAQETWGEVRDLHPFHKVHNLVF